MAIRFQLIETVTSNFYAMTPLNVGDVVSLKDKSLNKVCPIHIALSKVPIGISRHQVVDINKSKYPIVYLHTIGSKIEILTQGEITTQFNKSLHLPLYQPIYVNLSNSTLTWKRLGPQVGTTTLPQDKDGFVPIVVNFNKGY